MCYSNICQLSSPRPRKTADLLAGALRCIWKTQGASYRTLSHSELRWRLSAFIEVGVNFPTNPVSQGAKTQALTEGPELLGLGPPHPQLALQSVDTFPRGVCLVGGSGSGLRGPLVGAESHCFRSGFDFRADLYICI